MGPTERAIPSLLELMREDGANPKEGRPLSIERIYAANLITEQQMKQILEENREERRRERNSRAISEMEGEQLEIDRRMRRANVPETLVGVAQDASGAEALARGDWLYVHSTDSEDASRRACMALKGWLALVPFGTAAYVRSTTALSSFRENADGAAMRLQTVGLLLLSGLGTEAATDWAVSQLFDLLDTRALSGLPTIVASVHMPDALAAHLGGRGNEGAAQAIVGILKKHAAIVQA